MPIVTVDEFEQFGQVDITNQTDAAILQYIASAQAVAETWCNRLFDYAANIAETLDGKRATMLRLATYPVEVVTTVTEDGTALVEGTDFDWYPNGQLVRITGGNLGHTVPWTHKRKAVAVVYSGGYGGAGPEAVPDDLKWVVANVALRLYKAEAAWAATPVGVGGGLTALSLDGIGSAAFAGGTANTAVAQRASQQQAGSGPSLTPAEKQGLGKYRRRTVAGAWRPQGTW
jgi:hypothetical protein